MADVRTFGNMVSRISRELRRDGLTADIKDAIVDAIHCYETNRFSFNERSAHVVTTTNDPYLSSLPSGLMELDRVEMDQGGSREELSPAHYAWITDVDTGNSTGAPYHYTLYKGGMRLYPVPDQAYSVHLSYQTALLEVSASASSGATNAWMQEGEALIRSKAKAYVAAHRLRNYELAVAMERIAEMELRNLKSREIGLISTGIIQKTRF